MNDVDPCFMCIMDQYSAEKVADDYFWYERKNEFYPSDEWGNCVLICGKCKNILLEYKEKNLL